MNRNYIIGIIIFWCLNFYGQANETDNAYKNNVNQNYSGDVKETGVNANKLITNKLVQQDKKLHSTPDPEGWDELLKQAQVAVDKERKDQQKNDSIKKELEYKSKLASIEKKESENFRNKMLTYFIGLLILIICIFSIRKINKMAKGKLTLTDLRRISPREVLFISLGIGILVSILSGSLFSRTKYFKLYKNTSVEVSKEISTFELNKFNYLVAIVCFILFTGISYFYLNSKRKETSN